jgi:uncharacterized protein YegL
MKMAKTKKSASKNGASANGKETVHVGLLIDETGSMTGTEPAVVGGINEFIGTLAAAEADNRVLVTLAMFDLHGQGPIVRMKFAGIPLDEVAPLGPGDYMPRGSTPLNDAVVKTVRSMARKVKKSDRAMLVVLTDGLENSSETPTGEVRQLIREKEKAGWEFIYMGANQDAWAESGRIGLGAHGKHFNYDASPEGTVSAMRVSADRASTFRRDPERYKAEADELVDTIKRGDTKASRRSR